MRDEEEVVDGDDPELPPGDVDDVHDTGLLLSAALVRPRG